MQRSRFAILLTLCLTTVFAVVLVRAADAASVATAGDESSVTAAGAGSVGVSGAAVDDAFDDAAPDISQARRPIVTTTPLRFDQTVSTPMPSLTVRTTILITLDIDPADTTDGESAAPLRTLRDALHWLRIQAARSSMTQTLRQPPFDAVIEAAPDQPQNTLTVTVDGNRLNQIRNLPGVASATVIATDPPLAQPYRETPIARPSRGVPAPGTRLPPLVPPSLDERNDE